MDIILFAWDGERLKTLIIQRKNPPFQGQWAFPGGFIELNELLIESATREMAEETSVELETDELIQFYTAGDPGRDPRGRTISVCYFAFKRLDELSPKAADDAQSLAWFDVYEPPPLAFDHQFILEKAIESLRDYFLLKPESVIPKLITEKITMENLHNLLQTIFYNYPDINKIQKILLDHNILKFVGKNE